MKQTAMFCAATLLAVVPAFAQQTPGKEPVTIHAAVLRVDKAGLPPISRLDLPPDDLGFAGARLAIEDNDTTGKFLGQDFDAVEVAATPETAKAEMDKLLAQNIPFIIVIADDATTLALADQVGDKATVFNAAAQGDNLRAKDCRANTIHVAPSHAMEADGLAQFLMWKKWPNWFLVKGSHPEDEDLAAALRRAAEKFGAKITEERVYEDTGGARRTDTGYVQVQKQMPVFTQNAKKYDVLVAADEAGIFAEYLPYQTWDPRPIAG